MKEPLEDKVTVARVVRKKRAPRKRSIVIPEPHGAILKAVFEAAFAVMVAYHTTKPVVTAFLGKTKKKLTHRKKTYENKS